MNKSKLREQIADILAEVCYNFDSDDYYINIDEVKEDEVYKETLIKLEKLFDENRKAILEEVRSIIGEDEKEGEHDRCSTDEDIYCYSCQKVIEEGSVDHFRAGRNDFRAELRQKLSILEGKNGNKE